MTVTDRTAATDAEFRSRIAAFESAPVPPESFDPIAALRRVEALAAEYERTPPGTVTRDRDVALDLRAALATQAGDGAR